MERIKNNLVIPCRACVPQMERSARRSSDLIIWRQMRYHVSTVRDTQGELLVFWDSQRRLRPKQ